MKNFFVIIKNFIDKTLEWLVIFLMAGMVIDVLIQVVGRYIFRNPPSWTDELAPFFLMWIGLLGSSVALRRKAHLGIDALTQRLPQKLNNYVYYGTLIVVGLFSVVIMLWGGTLLTIKVFQTNQQTPSLGFKMAYVYLSLPISGLFNLLYLGELAKERFQENKALKI